MLLGIPYYNFWSTFGPHKTTGPCMTKFLLIPPFRLYFLLHLGSRSYPCEKSSIALTWSLSLGEMSWLLASSTVRLTALAKLSSKRVELDVPISLSPVLITWPITRRGGGGREITLVYSSGLSYCNLPIYMKNHKLVKFFHLRQSQICKRVTAFTVWARPLN